MSTQHREGNPFTAACPQSGRGGFLGCFRAGCVIFALSALILSGCGRDPEPLRIALNAWPGYGPIYLAQDKGFFREAGVEVKLLEFGALADARRAFEDGKVDGMATTIVEVLMARDATQRDLRILRVVDFSSGADMIAARKDVRSMRDLRGKRVGVEIASLGIYVLARALELEGMTLEDVNLVPKDQSSMCKALLDGNLEAVVTYPPDSSSVLGNPEFRAVFTSREIPGEIADVIAMDAEVLKERPEQVAAFLAAIDLAHAYMRENPDDAYRIMAARVRLPVEAFSSVLRDEITMVSPLEQAAYLGEGGKLRPILEAAAASLRHVGVLSDRPGLTDSLTEP